MGITKIKRDDASFPTDSSDDSDTKVEIKDSGLLVNKTHSPAKREVGEEAWNSAAEALVSKWAETCLQKSEYHSKAETRNTYLHSVFGLPSLLLPVVMAAATPVIDQLESAVYVQVAGLVTIGVVSTINTFFNFGTKANKHGEFASRFHELATDVQYQLFKSREFRTSSDEFVARVQTKFNNLNANEP